MFCTSLRRRKDWVPAIPHLLQNKDPKFRESKLDTHDVNLPLPSPKEAPGTRYLRFILLSSADHDMTAVHQRVERLENLSGGCDAALVWLLGEGGDGASAFLHFQLNLLDKFEIPLVPLQAIENLPSTLQRFHRMFIQSDTATRQPQLRTPDSGAVQTLLPYNGLSPPLREHSVHVLTDLTIGFGDLANKASTAAGRLELADYLGEEEAQRVILFWSQEYLK
ncbi:hypothetical protein VSDG_04528 [Cytospora chrysosperma]|uniref:Uncharacterized protein n=1 Tax=Cytospora chrysosperma TaxID=252740 RepID=A0A423W2H5_CYTCH|nr:hypothetical protein VSDG_04528 [Valsa sordida]